LIEENKKIKGCTERIAKDLKISGREDEQQDGRIGL